MSDPRVQRLTSSENTIVGLATGAIDVSADPRGSVNTTTYKTRGLAGRASARERRRAQLSSDFRPRGSDASAPAVAPPRTGPGVAATARRRRRDGDA